MKTTTEDQLDEVFHALANRTRRALVRRLADAGPARVTELAEPLGMSVAAVSKHLFVLERAGLIRRTRDGNVQSCVLEPAAMESADGWLGIYRHFWNRQFDRLTTFVTKGNN